MSESAEHRYSRDMFQKGYSLVSFCKQALTGVSDVGEKQLLQALFYALDCTPVLHYLFMQNGFAVQYRVFLKYSIYKISVTIRVIVVL